jgi:signal transduction histidine kinase
MRALTFMTILAASGPLPGAGDVVEVRQARRMTEGALVRVTGGITFCSHDLRLGFVEDETAGIAFDPGGGPDARLIPGAKVEVAGRLSSRDGMLILTKATWSVLTGQSFPPRRNNRLEDIGDMRKNAEFAGLRGTLREVLSPVPGVTAWARVEVSSMRGFATVVLPAELLAGDAGKMVDEVAQFGGVVVCSAAHPWKQSGADGIILVQDAAHWRVKPIINLKSNSEPPMSLASLLRESRTGLMAENRALIRGTVLWSRPAEDLFLRTTDGPVQVLSRQRSAFQAGDEVTVLAWPVMEQSRLALRDAVTRLERHGPPPLPRDVAVPAISEGGSQAELVRVKASLLDLAARGRQQRLLLESDGMKAAAWVAGEKMTASLHPGALLEVTGICLTGKSSGVSRDGVDVSLMLRSQQDITVLSAGSWWTPERLRVAVLVLGGVGTLGALGVLLLRWQIARQTAIIAERDHSALVVEERRRISREFHDSLQQQLVGVAYQIQTAADTVQARPGKASAMLEQSRHMMRHCQDEVRRTIWDLREGVLAEKGLSHALQDWIGSQRREDGPLMLFQESGREEEKAARPLPGDTTLHVFRIAQEAVANALRHSGARHITVTLDWLADSLSLRVTDDGIGFETVVADAPTARFGLRGMRERAAKLHGRLDLSSSPDSGAIVHLQLPLSHP